jgi:flagellar protein FlaI
MRPDRIIMGEIRKQKEAEVLFEAMHTGHSVYATLHADTCAQTISRLTNPPINIPHGMLDSVHLNVVMFRDRRNRFRRVFEVGEFAPVTSEKTDETRYVPKILYRWDPPQDALKPTAEEAGFYERIAACTGLSNEDIKSQIETKKSILSWAVKHNVRKIDDMGRLMNLYYTEYEDIVEAVKKDASPGNVLADKAEEQYE